jgi:hypothetical protein
MNQIQLIDGLAWTWLLLAGGSTVYVAWDQFAHNPEAPVMKWGWALVTLYMGPVGLALYVMSDKEPAPGAHEEFVTPLWKQGVGSTVHCVAGDATGIIAAAAVTATLGFPMWTDLIVEYLAGFVFGLFIFQALFMKDMLGGSYARALLKSLIPEWLSMNMMMAGMAVTMIYLMMGRDMRAMNPAEPLFWVVMSLGVVVGFVVPPHARAWRALLRDRRRRQRAAPGRAVRGGHGQRGTGTALRRRLDRPRTRSMAPALSHPPPHAQRQRGGGGRWGAHDDHQRHLVRRAQRSAPVRTSLSIQATATRRNISWRLSSR